MKKDQKGFGVIEVLCVLVIVGLIGIAGWFVLERQSGKNAADVTSNSKQSGKTKTDTASNQQTKDPYKDWKTFCSSTYPFCFRYPSNWKTPLPELENAGQSNAKWIATAQDPKEVINLDFEMLLAPSDITDSTELFVESVTPNQKSSWSVLVT